MYNYQNLRNELKRKQDTVCAPVLYKDVWVAGPVGSGYETVCNLELGAFYHVLGYRDSSWHPDTWLADYSAILRTITDPSQPPRAMFGVGESCQLVAMLPWASVIWLDLSDDAYRERVYAYRREVGLDEAGNEKAFNDLLTYARTCKAMIRSGCELANRSFSELDANRSPEQIRDDIFAIMAEICPVDTADSLRKADPEIASMILEHADKYEAPEDEETQPAEEKRAEPKEDIPEPKKEPKKGGVVELW